MVMMMFVMLLVMTRLLRVQSQYLKGNFVLLDGDLQQFKSYNVKSPPFNCCQQIMDKSNRRWTGWIEVNLWMSASVHS